MCRVCNGGGKRTWWIDSDGDGKGSKVKSQVACSQPKGYAGRSDDDCDGVLDDCRVCSGGSSGPSPTWDPRPPLVVQGNTLLPFSYSKGYPSFPSYYHT